MKTKSLIAVFLIFITCVLINCKRNEKESFDTLDKTPFANKLSLKKMDADGEGRNLIISASFDKSEVSENSFWLQDDDGKTFYHDDGQDDDKEKNDGIFTAKIKVDYKEINAFIEETNKSKIKNVLSFRHRQIVGNQNVSSLSLVSFQNGNEIVINQALPFDEKLRDHSLMIQDKTVIEDPARTLVFRGGQWTGTPNGVWTFGYVMRQMANESLTGVNAEQFTMEWLNNWKTDVVINGDTSKERKAGIEALINRWPKKPGTTVIDLDKAPFKLTAIVNRVDLKGNFSYYGNNGKPNAGEGRFVFNVFDAGGNPQSFNVIFEYGYNFTKEKPLQNYQKKWASLKDKTFGTPDYNNTLESLTKEFTDADKNPSKPNKNCINQIRTNEIALAGPWELREFHLDATTHLLKQVSPNREPQDKFNAKADNPDVRFMVKWVNDHTGKVPSTPFEPKLMGASAKNGSANIIWNGIQTPNPPEAFITNDDDRFDLSINTCSGCHGTESGSGFTHIDPDGTLSLFIKGGGFNIPNNVPDAAGRPNGNPKVRGFNDLDNRAQILHKFAGLPPAISKLIIDPVISSD